ncbi:MAG: hypothetical protein KJ930_02280 [Gammaproteobacteria bacterium]|jgi:hypothetical protein|nr:hypothetical protein [Gammaproteobacteria bacterium]MBU2178237.1 hypothetical protein [Gammaproteobacteria bacterium]MBU2425485.1 hypothetical protein [Gammaproteobacteria bacterium]
MKTRHTLWATSLLLASFASIAGSNGYKMVVIEEDLIAGAISAGNLSSVLADSAVVKADDVFARQMSLCVAYAKTERFDLAAEACNKAVIVSRQNATRPTENVRTLKSYAYSNRGVSKILIGDNIGALADFQRADDIESSAVSQHNLNKLVMQLNGPMATRTAMLSNSAPE